MFSHFLSQAYLPQQTEGGVEIRGAAANQDQEQPDQVDPIATVTRVLPVQDHQERRHNEEEDIGDGVDELRDVRGEGVVVLTPVYRAGAPLQMAPHAHNHSTVSQLTSGLQVWKTQATEPGLYQE